MDAYEAGKPMYFATPPVNLIRAYRQALLEITQGPVTLEERFALHTEAKNRIKGAITNLGLEIVPKYDSVAANGMSAVSPRAVRYHLSELVLTSLVDRFICLMVWVWQILSLGWRHEV